MLEILFAGTQELWPSFVFHPNLESGSLRHGFGRFFTFFKIWLFAEKSSPFLMRRANSRLPPVAKMLKKTTNNLAVNGERDFNRYSSDFLFLFFIHPISEFLHVVFFVLRKIKSLLSFFACHESFSNHFGKLNMIMSVPIVFQSIVY